MKEPSQIDILKALSAATSGVASPEIAMARTDAVAAFYSNRRPAQETQEVSSHE